MHILGKKEAKLLFEKKTLCAESMFRKKIYMSVYFLYFIVSDTCKLFCSKENCFKKYHQFKLGFWVLKRDDSSSTYNICLAEK